MPKKRVFWTPHFGIFLGKIVFFGAKPPKNQKNQIIKQFFFEIIFGHFKREFLALKFRHKFSFKLVL